MNEPFSSTSVSRLRRYKPRQWAAATMFTLALAAIMGCRSTSTDARPSSSAFDERTDGRTLFAQALNRAQAEKKRVLLWFGANWCPYCKVLRRIMESDPDIIKLLEDSYVVLPVDVGSSSRNRNTGLIDRYDAPVYTEGLPSLVITDATGKKLAPSRDNPRKRRRHGRRSGFPDNFAAGSESRLPEQSSSRRTGLERR